MEYVDVINEHNEVLSPVSKQEAHEQGLLHRVVIAEIIGTDGSWTLIQQSADRQDAGQYVSPVGGHVHAGESIIDALKREANEEYGLGDEFNFQQKGQAIYNREILNRKENHLFLIFEIYTDQPPVLNEESVGYERMSPEQLAQQLKTSPQKFGAAFHFVINACYPHLLT